MREVPTNRRTKASERTTAACAVCGRETAHILLKAIARDRVSSDELINWYDDYEILKCSGCGEISFRHTFVSDDDSFGDEDEVFLNEHVRYYPPRISGLKRMEGWEYLPYPVRNVFDESFSALENGMPLLATIGMRAIIEATAVDKKLSVGGSKPSLEAMLRKMLESKMIRTTV